MASKNKYVTAYDTWIDSKKSFRQKNISSQSLAQQLGGSNIFDFTISKDLKSVADKSLMTGVKSGLEELKKQTASIKQSNKVKDVQKYAELLKQLTESLQRFAGTDTKFASDLNKFIDLSKELKKGLNKYNTNHKSNFKNIGEMVSVTSTLMGRIASLNSETYLAKLLEEAYNTKDFSLAVLDMAKPIMEKTLRGKLEIDSPDIDKKLGSIQAGNELVDIRFKLQKKGEKMELNGEVDSDFRISMKQYLTDNDEKIASLHWRRVLIAIANLNNSADLFWSLYRALAANERTQDLKTSIAYELGMDAAFGGKLGTDRSKNAIYNQTQITDFWVNNKLYSAKYIYNRIRQQKENAITVEIPYPNQFDNMKYRNTIAHSLLHRQKEELSLNSEGIINFILSKEVFK